VGLEVDKKYEALNVQKQNEILIRQTRESDWLEICAVVIGVILVSLITVRCSTPPSCYIMYFVSDDPRFENR
jgi:bacteriorhodopsin